MRASWARLTAILRAIVQWRWFWTAAFVACLVPGARILYNAFYGDLGVDPVKTLLHESGELALLMLLLSLAVTPFRRIFGINQIQRVRRMIGLWAFFYAFCHLSMYLAFDQLCYSIQTCEFRAIWQDILKRPYIFMGMLAFSLLLLLALTSTNGWQRRLRKNWGRLHRIVYVAGVAAIIHFIWIQKSDISVPLKWAFWLALLLGFRVVDALRKRLARPGRSEGPRVRGSEGLAAPPGA
jgi:sulfoxide reductase heme-binding subunit YedZ